MCVICGCNEAVAPSVEHAHAPSGAQTSQGHLHYGHVPAGATVPGMSPMRAIELQTDVMAANNGFAKHNRAHFAAHGVHAYNLLSSPGSGKTTLLCATLQALHQQAPHWPMAVIEGDQQTSLDAERIRATGVPAIQVNTGRGCHLDAQMVGEAFNQLDLHGHGHTHANAHTTAPLLFIENVGNLVCPALWDLGERAKVVVLSVTEGEDKPLKYPDMFAAAHLMLINKIDLLAHVQFDVDRCIAYARRINPGIEVLQISATRGDGMDAWLAWLRAA